LGSRKYEAWEKEGQQEREGGAGGEGRERREGWHKRWVSMGGEKGCEMLIGERPHPYRALLPLMRISPFGCEKGRHCRMCM
jgi:hypothetical protein